MSSSRVRPPFRTGAIVARTVMALLMMLLSLLCLSLHSEKQVLGSACLGSRGEPKMLGVALDEFTDLKLSGGFIVARGGDVIAEGYCGLADPVRGTRVGPETRFNIGSVTKQFTGYVVVELIREGKIALEDEVSRFLPELEGRAVGHITIRQLMSMKSGLPANFPASQFAGAQLSGNIRGEGELIALIKELQPQSGAKFSYSNLNFVILGLVIGKIERSSWADSIQSRIFSPLQMPHSATEGTSQEVPMQLAAGLLPLRLLGRVYFLTLPHWNYSMIKGAGGIVSTLQDLHLWDEALRHRAHADGDWARQYFPGPGDYAFGWMRVESSKAKMFVHGGEDPGYCAQNMILPDLDAHVIIATNSDYCAFNTDALKPFSRAVIEALTH